MNRVKKRTAAKCNGHSAAAAPVATATVTASNGDQSMDEGGSDSNNNNESVSDRNAFPEREVLRRSPRNGSTSNGSVAMVMGNSNGHANGLAGSHGGGGSGGGGDSARTRALLNSTQNIMPMARNPLTNVGKSFR